MQSGKGVMKARMSLRVRLVIVAIAAVFAVLITAAVGLYGMVSSNQGLET